MFEFMRALRYLPCVDQLSANTIRLGIVCLLGVTLSACVAPNSHDLTATDPASGLSGSGHADLPPSQVASLEHLSAADLVARLGPPNFTRRDAPAELWQYRGASCVLDVFLYPDGDTMRVSHAQTRDRHGTEAVGLGANLCSPFSPETTASTS